MIVYERGSEFPYTSIPQYKEIYSCFVVSSHIWGPICGMEGCGPKLIPIYQIYTPPGKFLYGYNRKLWM
jgi:hypothetical protein